MSELTCGCEHHHAWRCAVAKGLTESVVCQCSCHRITASEKKLEALVTKVSGRDVMNMWLTEVKPLVKELECRENRRNNLDEANRISEIMERFEKVITPTQEE